MLIPFPLAFFVGAFIFDVIYLISQNENLRLVGYYLSIAGIVGGLLAAVPGIIDYLYTVPPNSSGKKRATRHGLINVTNVVVFVIAVFYRQNANANPYIVTGFELIGVILLFIAGWMGGTLVYRNQIGVDIRYAYAGKWKEKIMDAAEGRLEVAAINELKVNQMKLVQVKDKRIVIGRTDKGYVAFDDHCTHKGGSLAGGAMICETVQCPWHGSHFDVTTGAVKAGPAKENIATYRVEENNGKVYLLL